MPNWQHRQQVCKNAAIWGGGSNKWVVVGEWSGSETDCAKYLNGYKVGARYDGTFPNSTYVGTCADKNNITQWDEQMKEDVRSYIEVQLDTFESHANGWIFWNFKTQEAHEWDAFALIDAGLFPQPLTDRKYGTNCSYQEV
jgi:glucan 1,3-beta-glucosidase